MVTKVKVAFFDVITQDPVPSACGDVDFFHGRRVHDSRRGRSSIAWLKPDGNEMDDGDVLLLNGYWEPLPFKLAETGV